MCLLPATRADLPRRLERRVEAVAAYREGARRDDHRCRAALPQATDRRMLVSRIGMSLRWPRGRVWVSPRLTGRLRPRHSSSPYA